MTTLLTVPQIQLKCGKTRCKRLMLIPKIRNLLIFQAYPRHSPRHNAYHYGTEYGACCLIVPYLNLFNLATRDTNHSNLSNAKYHNFPQDRCSQKAQDQGAC